MTKILTPGKDRAIGVYFGANPDRPTRPEPATILFFMEGDVSAIKGYWRGPLWRPIRNAALNPKNPNKESEEVPSISLL